MTRTPNYNLCQWALPDRLMMEDFNADNAKIDAALQAQANAMTAQTDAQAAALAAKAKELSDALADQAAKQTAALNAQASAQTAALNAKAKELADTQKADVSEIQMSLSERGNCQIYMIPYFGTGEYGSQRPVKMTFPQRPLLVIVGGERNFLLVMPNGVPYSSVITSGGHPDVYVSWQGNSVSWYGNTSPGYMLNEANTIYYAFALCSND